MAPSDPAAPPSTLEDDYTDVLHKALRGQGSTLEWLATASQTDPDCLATFANGTFSAEVARRVAPHLHLDPEAFARLPGHVPPSPDLPEITRIALPYTWGSVNVWLIRHNGAMLVFDAGPDADATRRAFADLGAPKPTAIFITHLHADHTGGLPALANRNTMTYSPGLRGTFPLAPGAAIHCRSLVVNALDLSGHANPALGYRIDGLASPVLVTGDALFAGSIGGCSGPPAYQHALATLRATLDPLPPETVLLPGHGPATRLGAERTGNPFL